MRSGFTCRTPRVALSLSALADDLGGGIGGPRYITSA